MKQVMRWVSVVALGLMLTTMAHAEFKWSGYTQVRFNNWDDNMGKSSDSQFQMRRSRIKVVGDVADDTNIALQVDFSNLVNDEKGSSNIELKDAVITRKVNSEWKATIGYTSIPFGYEVPSSDSANLFFEKSQVMNKLFAGERDTGLYARYTPAKPNAPSVDLGFSNGPRKWYDKDKDGNRDEDSRAFVGRVQMPLANAGSAGVSYMKASREGKVGGQAFDFSNSDIFGAHVNYVFPKNWNLRAEYYDGHLPKAGASTAVNQKVNGWYGYAAYALDDKPVTIFGRYDTYDSGGSNNYNRYVAGVGVDRKKNDRYSFQIERITNDGSGKSDTNLGVQWQVKY